jgi:hypothetical protein
MTSDEDDEVDEDEDVMGRSKVQWHSANTEDSAQLNTNKQETTIGSNDLLLQNFRVEPTYNSGTNLKTISKDLNYLLGTFPTTFVKQTYLRWLSLVDSNPFRLYSQANGQIRWLEEPSKGMRMPRTKIRVEPTYNHRTQKSAKGNRRHNENDTFLYLHRTSTSTIQGSNLRTRTRNPSATPAVPRPFMDQSCTQASHYLSHPANKNKKIVNRASNPATPDPILHTRTCNLSTHLDLATQGPTPIHDQHLPFPYFRGGTKQHETKHLPFPYFRGGIKHNTKDAD